MTPHLFFGTRQLPSAQEFMVDLETVGQPISIESDEEQVRV